MELEANAFAQAMLMPAEFLTRDFKGRRIDVRDDAGMRQMAQRYQVSVAALTIRLVELRMLHLALGGRWAVRRRGARCCENCARRHSVFHHVVYPSLVRWATWFDRIQPDDSPGPFSHTAYVKCT